MRPEQRDEPDDDDPVPLPSPSPDWRQRRVDEPRGSWTTVGNVIGVILGAVLVIAGLAVVGFVVLFYVGMSHYGSNK